MAVGTRIRRIGARLLSPQFGSRWKARALRWIARSALRTRIWYLIRGAYVREQQAMLAGIAEYHVAEAGGAGGPIYRLRRDVHRIEKGLSVPSPRETFAERYIEEAVEALAKVVSSCHAGTEADRDGTIAWAADVLGAYFERVTPTIVTERARRQYERVVASLQHDGTRVPRPKDAAICPVDYEKFLRMTTRRRSVRAFLPEPVPRSVIDAACEAARQSPSACNRQAFEFRVFDDPELVEDLVDLAPGFDVHGRKVPAMIVVVGKYRAYFRERDMHVIYIDASLATMALVLALESLGFASCCINWPSIAANDRALGDWLVLDPDEEIVMLVAVGRADEVVSSPYSEKAGLDRIRSFNRR